MKKLLHWAHHKVQARVLSLLDIWTATKLSLMQLLQRIHSVKGGKKASIEIKVSI